MARRTELTCDGCDTKQFVKADAILPADWATVTVQIDGFKVGYPSLGMHNGLHSYDLCAFCQRHLVDSALPTHWPRMKEETAA